MTSLSLSIRLCDSLVGSILRTSNLLSHDASGVALADSVAGLPDRALEGFLVWANQREYLQNCLIDIDILLVVIIYVIILQY